MLPNLGDHQSRHKFYSKEEITISWIFAITSFYVYKCQQEPLAHWKLLTISTLRLWIHVPKKKCANVCIWIKLEVEKLPDNIDNPFLKGEKADASNTQIRH